MANAANPMKGKTFQSGKEDQGRQDKRPEGDNQSQKLAQKMPDKARKIPAQKSSQKLAEKARRIPR